jgi:hypothetical protein
MSTELVLCIVLAFASVVLILAHERGREAAATLWAGALLYFLVRTKPANEPTIQPKPIERVTNDEIHTMDDAAAGLPADTVTADQLRDWARDDVRD